ncbi:hypothetical protein F3157_17295 [Virgibacillus dakarensis]|uniref:Alpha/beta hydrolase n=1 Tax=Lentibacillus populi TaxID=1827502 RepID=A0A9W5U1Y6_9BACI|nr:hypothetical protein [Virgibacillus dakarensis]GGB60371.1 hypothetical protein GCM10011409_42180 [Lentibacillus populi]
MKSEIPSLYVIGNEDPDFSEELIGSLNNELVSGLIIPDANHGLEVKGDIKATINAAMQVITSV